jgi:DNA-binding MarR family transcriptional regulator
MKSYDEILFIITLLITFLKCRPSLSPSYSDDEWVVVISGRDDLEKIMKINGFELHPERKRKLNTILSTYKRKQVKKGDVYLTYLKLLLNLQSKKFDGVTIKDLTKTIDRDRTRIAAIFKMFYEKGLVNRRRLNGSGRPYCYTITEDGIKLINKLSSSPQI